MRQPRYRDESSTTLATPHGVTAWLIAAYLVVRSRQFFSSLAWIASSYVARGWAPATAGYLVAPAARLGPVGILPSPDTAAWVWECAFELG